MANQANQGGGGAGQQELVVTDRSTRVPVPVFSADNYKAYSDEVEMWREVCNVPKAKQGIILWLALPRGDASVSKS